MSYEVVARRWRPLTFDSVVGQRHVTSTLATAIERDRVAHAFIFTGIRGVGKTTVARVLARALNCSNRQGSEPCNECSSCKQVLTGSSVDVIEIDGASNNGIEEVRALIEASQYRPATGKYRIYIIDEVHQLSKPAFNALLKTLEEPPSHVKFILATTEVHKVLETVLSRCQRYDFRRLSVKEITDQLAMIVERDGLEVSAEALALIAREAGGSMRDAQSLLEQLAAVTGGHADVADVQMTLGVAPTEVIAGIVEAVLGRDGARVVELSHQVREAGHDPERVMHEVLEQVRNVCVAAAAGARALDDTMSDALRDAAVAVKDERNALDLHRIFNSLLRSTEDLRHGSMPDLVFEMGLLKAAALESVLASSEILAMLDGAPPPPQQSSGAGARGATRSREQPRASAPSSPGPKRRTGGATAAPPTGTSGQPTPRPEASASRRAEQAAPQAGVPASVRESQPTPPEAPPHPADDAAVELSGDAAKWQAFLDYVASASAISATVALGNCEVVALEAERVVIKPMSVARQQLASASVIAKIQELVHGHFGHGVKFEISSGDAGTTAAAGTGISSHSLEEERRARMERDALDDPLVQGAVDVLGGRVRSISSLDE